MIITKLDSSSTMPRFKIDFENIEESMRTDNQLFDEIESFNYGGIVQFRNADTAMLQVYID